MFIKYVCLKVDDNILHIRLKVSGLDHRREQFTIYDYQAEMMCHVQDSESLGQGY